VVKFRGWSAVLEEGRKKTVVDKAFLKYYVTPASWKELYLRTRGRDANFQVGYEEVLALNYEMLVYEYVVKPLIDRDICPHFIRIFSHSRYCSFADLTRMYPQPFRIKRSVAYMFNNWRDRPAVTDPVLDSDPHILAIAIFPADQLQYSIIMNQAIDPTTTKTMRKFVEELILTPTPAKRLEVVISLFQCAYACYALYLSGTAHNDLHNGNVWVTRRPERKNVKYTVDGVEYKFQGIGVCARLYDFDHSYTKSIGKNLLIEGELCAQSSQCNYVTSAKDFIKLICYVYRALGEDWLVELFCSGADIAFWKGIYGQPECFLTSAPNVAIPESAYSRAFTYPQIIGNIYAKYVKLLGGTAPTPTTFNMQYSLAATMFDSRGKLLPGA
jgi:hypothetical protein